MARLPGMIMPESINREVLFSVIVPTCNRTEALSACLERLKPGAQVNGTLVSDSIAAGHLFGYEVIVSNDGSEATIGDLRKLYPWARWIDGPRRGPAANRNCGAAIAGGTWLVFLDDDCIAEPNWLDSYFQYRDTESVLEGKTVSGWPKRGALYTSPENLSGGYLWSCNFAIRQNVFQELDGFDPKFPMPHMEDVDLRERLLAGTHKIRFVADASVFHEERRDIPGFHSARRNESEIYFHLKHGRSFHLWGLIKGKLRHYYKRLRKGGSLAEQTRFLVGACCEALAILWLYPQWKLRHRSMVSRNRKD